MANDDKNSVARAATCRRLQFSLFSLFVLTTAACLALTWWVWPQNVDVISITIASASPIPVSQRSGPATQPQTVNYRDEFLAALHDPKLLQHAVDVTGNGHLPMLQKRSDPVGWVRKRLEIEALKNTSVSIKLTVPEYFGADAVEFVDYITLKALTQATTNLGRQTRKYAHGLQQQQRALQQDIKATIARLKEVSKSDSVDSEQGAALQSVLKSQVNSLNNLNREVDAALLADASTIGLQSVQMATVIKAGQ